MRLESQLNALERDRKRVESSAIRRTLGTLQRARRFASAAVLIGHSPEQAARLALNDLTSDMAATLTVARLAGLRRTQLNAQRATGERISFGGVLLSREEDEKKREREYAAWLLLMLGLRDDTAIKASVTPIAYKAAQGLAGPLTEQLNKVRRVGALPAGYSIDFKPGVILKPEQAVRDIFVYTGNVPDAPWNVARWVETSVVKEYERGRWDGTRHPAIKESLWGFTYSTINDARRSELCTKLDGMTVPLGDPAIEAWMPPNHFFCRSAWVEVWESGALKRPTIIQPKVSLDDLVRFTGIRRKFRSYLQ